jgi:fructose-1,6-bisphosphatase/inositol monophosphatase family enzyme
MSHIAFVTGLFDDYDAITLPLHGAVDGEDKPDGSSVTQADLKASQHALSRLKAYTPDYGVISEEEECSYLPQARMQWAVDPLDGTASFARGLPVWGLGMGLIDGAEPVAGYLHFPVVRETFTYEDGVARRNGNIIRHANVRQAPDTRNVMITSIHDYVDVRRIKGHRIHNLGSNLYHLMMLATGRCEAIITGPCYLWDMAPALPFTRALGYVERYLDGTVFEMARLTAAPYGFPMPQPLIVGPASTVDMLLEQLS